MCVRVNLRRYMQNLMKFDAFHSDENAGACARSNWYCFGTEMIILSSTYAKLVNKLHRDSLKWHAEPQTPSTNNIASSITSYFLLIRSFITVTITIIPFPPVSLITHLIFISLNCVNCIHTYSNIITLCVRSVLTIRAYYRRVVYSLCLRIHAC